LGAFEVASVKSSHTGDSLEPLPDCKMEHYGGNSFVEDL
jgi:hypothetical protein